jgi:D-aminopeptidase
MFNHLVDAHQAAVDVLPAVLGEERRQPKAAVPAPAWFGNYIEPETGLAVRIDAAGNGQVNLRYSTHPERLDLHSDGTANCASARLRPDKCGLWMDRPHENQTSLLYPCEGAPTKNVAGRYRCEELDAELTVIDAGGVLYGSFSGFLGQGRMEMLGPIGADIWTLPCLHALDHAPPGDWTLAFRCDEASRVVSINVGCWLARQLPYLRVG